MKRKLYIKMRSSNKNRRISRDTRVTSTRQFTPFRTIVTREFTTTAATYASTSIFTTANICNDLSSSARLLQLKRVTFDISSTNILGTTSGSQALLAQVRLYDYRTNLYIPYTDVIALNNVRRTRLQAVASPTFATWNNATSTVPLFDLVIWNPQYPTENAIQLALVVTTDFITSRDVPTNV
jgi:hypothetical protein